MTSIAFLGLGAMGTRMAARLAAAGHDLTLWNRTARPLPEELAGARVAATPAEAAAGAKVVVAMVRDDAASADVWLDRDEGALAALGKGAVAVDCSTLSVPHIRFLADRFAAAGSPFVAAPLAGSRPQAEAGNLIFFAGGPDDAVEAVAPILATMGSAVHRVGTAADATLTKLSVNGLFGAQVAILAEVMGMIRRHGGDLDAALAALTATPVASPALTVASGAMAGGQFAPAFPIDLVAKDFRLLHETGAAVDAPLPISTALRELFEEARAKGFGGDNITGIVQLFSRMA